MEDYEIATDIIMSFLFLLEFFLFTLYEVYKNSSLIPAMLLGMSGMIFIGYIYFRVKIWVKESGSS